MTAVLAIFTAQLGTPSETFIRRHVEDLLPGRTVVVARNSNPPFGGFWQASCPALFLVLWASRLTVRLAIRGGISDVRLRDRAVTQFLRHHKVDLVLGEYLDQFLDFVPTLQRMRIPYVVQGHGIDLSAALRKPGAAKRNLTYLSARTVLTRCEFHRQRLIGIGLPAGKIAVNPGGVDVPSQLPRRDAGAHKRFLALGRMVAKKGPIYLLEAFRQAAAQDTEITLDYVGGGQLLDAVRQYVRACGLQQRIRLHGHASDEVKWRLFRECGVFLQHSLTDPDTGDEEGLPASIQEAMAQGQAVISTRHSGIPEAVEHRVTGWLVEEGDVVGMADAILCLSRNNEVCQDFGSAGYTKAQQLYSWSAERERLLSALGQPVIVLPSSDF